MIASVNYCPLDMSVQTTMRILKLRIEVIHIVHVYNEISCQLYAYIYIYKFHWFFILLWRFVVFLNSISHYSQHIWREWMTFILWYISLLSSFRTTQSGLFSRLKWHEYDSVPIRTIWQYKGSQISNIYHFAN